MNVNIPLSAEMENLVRRRAADAGQEVELYLTQVVTESLVFEDDVVPTSPASTATFAERLENWIALHPVLNHPVDDSRESIYAGCGE